MTPSARCQHAMKDHGQQLVLACMRQDWSAAQKIKRQLESHPHIAKRCLAQMRDHGYTLVEACIRQDTSAEQKISDW
ncbi:hypothetical protein [Salinisphaera orenii]|uniref:hypothetical protein n=1 Tax=Salinisphaera orenii TaxID=856731 RepID=UPI0013A60F7A